MTCIRAPLDAFRRQRRTGRGATRARAGGGASREEGLVTGTTDVTAIHRRTEPCFLSLVDKSMHRQYPSTGRNHLTAGRPSLVPRAPLHSPPAIPPATTTLGVRAPLHQTQPAPAHSRAGVHKPAASASLHTWQACAEHDQQGSEEPDNGTISNK